LTAIEARWESSGLKIDTQFDGKEIHLSRIVVPKTSRGEGLGTKAMHDLVEFADKYKLVMTLTPSTDFGASSVERLKKFYQQFGFVNNKGRHADYAISASMYRLPR
jgi:predicted GNAT family N-acyltransferase